LLHHQEKLIKISHLQRTLLVQLSNEQKWAILNNYKQKKTKSRQILWNGIQTTSNIW